VLSPANDQAGKPPGGGGGGGGDGDCGGGGVEPTAAGGGASCMSSSGSGLPVVVGNRLLMQSSGIVLPPWLDDLLVPLVGPSVLVCWLLGIVSARERVFCVPACVHVYVSRMQDLVSF